MRKTLAILLSIGLLSGCAQQTNEASLSASSTQNRSVAPSPVVPLAASSQTAVPAEEQTGITGRVTAINGNTLHLTTLPMDNRDIRSARGGGRVPDGVFDSSKKQLDSGTGARGPGNDGNGAPAGIGTAAGGMKAPMRMDKPANGGKTLDSGARGKAPTGLEATGGSGEKIEAKETVVTLADTCAFYVDSEGRQQSATLSDVTENCIIRAVMDGDAAVSVTVLSGAPPQTTA